MSINTDGLKSVDHCKRRLEDTSSVRGVRYCDRLRILLAAWGLPHVYSRAGGARCF